jgi:hypothetical protein
MGLQQNGFVAVALSVRGDHPPNALQPKLPDGIHLRWGFERSHGFPWYGVYLFRRPHSAADRQRRVANVAGVSMRLVAMRNWRPEKERAEVDGIVRKARGRRRLRAMGGGKYRNDSRYCHRWCRNSRILAGVAGRPKKNGSRRS